MPADPKKYQCYLSALLVCIVILLACESFYFGVVGKHIWRPQLKAINGSAGNTSVVRMAAAGALVYVLLLCGILVFIVRGAESPLKALGWGALFGLIVYGVFNLTNYALFPGYEVRTAAVDSLWGAFLCAVLAGAATYASYNWIIIPEKYRQ